MSYASSRELPRRQVRGSGGVGVARWRPAQGRAGACRTAPGAADAHSDGYVGHDFRPATLVLGPREWMELLDRLDGIEGMIVTKDQKVLSSRGLSKYRA